MLQPPIVDVQPLQCRQAVARLAVTGRSTSADVGPLRPGPVPARSRGMGDPGASPVDLAVEEAGGGVTVAWGGWPVRTGRPSGPLPGYPGEDRSCSGRRRGTGCNWPPGWAGCRGRSRRLGLRRGTEPIRSSGRRCSKHLETRGISRFGIPRLASNVCRQPRFGMSHQHISPGRKSSPGGGTFLSPLLLFRVRFSTLPEPEERGVGKPPLRTTHGSACSRTVRIWLALTLRRLWRVPEGQWISTSSATSEPLSPRWTLGSWLER